jgi:hypothetical protein
MPRAQTSPRIAWLSALFPFCWLAFTLIRGAVIDWYPYPFIDVTRLGYGETVLNCCWLSVLLLGLAGGMTVLDSRLSRGPKPTASQPSPGGTSVP